MHPKIWCGAWPIITLRLDFGGVGIEAIISGSFGKSCLFHMYSQHLICVLRRYIYVPLGGSRNVIVNTILVFSFVALWHDLTFSLLAWGWLVTLFILPELLATYLLPASQVHCIPISVFLPFFSLNSDFCISDVTPV